MIIPTEARATLAVLAEGKSPVEFVAAIWKLRQKEHPILKGRKPRGQWPIVRAQDLPLNVTAIRRKAARP